ncbi:MAG: hypothetical protein IJ461_06445 [Clostridia bacterium]|nr:hypothetical protein [Clostridia bacterium]
MIDFKLLEAAIAQALAQLYKQDSYLINHASDHACERAVVFRFGHYFASVIEEQFPGYHVDCEYSLMLDRKRKILPSWPNGCYPDIILHRRGTPENALVLEFKAWWQENLEQEINRDARKILELKNTLGYPYGAVILLEKELPRILWV